MKTYEVTLYAQVWTSVTVNADDEEGARLAAFEEVGDDYEVDFEVEAVYEQ